MSDLSEALERCDEIASDGYGGGFYVPDVELFVEAARKWQQLANTGQRVEWCKVHDAQQDREDRSGFACDWADGKTECHIISRWLSDYREDE